MKMCACLEKILSMSKRGVYLDVSGFFDRCNDLDLVFYEKSPKGADDDVNLFDGVDETLMIVHVSLERERSGMMNGVKRENGKKEMKRGRNVLG